MDTSFLDNQEELTVEQFNGSFRKALNKKERDCSMEENNPEQSPRKKRKSPEPDKPDLVRQTSVRVSISKATDKRIRERILRQYLETGERLSIKQFVEDCIGYYLGDK